MSKTEPEWHNYDQNLFSRLAGNPDGQEAEKFCDFLNKELSTDLFSTGYKIAHTPFSFLEGIGLGTFPSPVSSILPGICFDRKKNQDLPIVITKSYQNYFSQHSEFSFNSLIVRAEAQLSKYTPNPVVAQLSENIIKYPLEALERKNDGYLATIHNHLAVEYALQFPYFDHLGKVCKNNSDRELVAQQLYHGFFQMAADAIKKGLNLSYFRSFDKARKHFSERAALKEKEASRKFEDPYFDAYLENNKDCNDSYLVHFSVCGFHFGKITHRVLSFTLDSPEIVKKRVEYCYHLLKWINKHMGYPFSLCPGVVYCFNKSLELKRKIDVAGMDFPAM